MPNATPSLTASLPKSSALQTQLLGSSDATETHAATLAAYDAKLAYLDRLIAVAEIAAKAEAGAK